jgi:hypothetical protein
MRRAEKVKRLQRGCGYEVKTKRVSFKKTHLFISRECGWACAAAAAAVAAAVQFDNIDDAFKRCTNLIVPVLFAV